MLVGQRVLVGADRGGRLEPRGRRQVVVLVDLEQLGLEDLRDPVGLALDVAERGEHLVERRGDLDGLAVAVSVGIGPPPRVVAAAAAASVSSLSSGIRGLVRLLRSWNAVIASSGSAA